MDLISSAGKGNFIAVRMMDNEELHDKLIRLERENNKLLALLAERDVFIGKREQRYKTIFDNIQDVYYETDVKGIILEVSPSVSAFSQYSREELIGKPIAMLYDEPDKREEYLKRLVTYGKLVDVEVVGHDKDGKRVYGLVNMQLLHDEDGQPCGIVGSFRDVTDRKHLENQFKESESRFRLIFETVSNIAVRGFTVDGTIKYWNRASEVLYGYSAEEVVGKNLLDLIVPLRKRGDMSDSIAQMIHSGSGGSSEEMLLMRKDGSYVSVISSHTVVSIPGQDPELFCIDIDLSERRAMEEALVVSESMYRTLFEANIDGIAIFSIGSDNIPGKFLEMNRAAAAMLGYSKEELLLLSPIDIEHQPTPELIERRQIALQTKGSVSFETKLRHKGGYSITVEMRAVLIQYQGVISVMNITRDITERKRTEAMLRMLSNATEQSPASIVITDSEGIIEYVNSKFTKVTGFCYEEAIGKNPRILKSGLTPPEVFEEMWNTVKNGKEWRGEFQNVKKSGELYYESAVISPIFDDDGHISHIVGVKENITERKLAEEALKQSERILRDAQEVARVGHYILDFKQGRWMSSGVLDEIFGIDNNFERTIDSWGQIIAPEQKDEMFQYLNECIKDYGLFKKDYKVIRISDRQVRWVSGIGEIEYDAEGNAVKMLGTIQDITDRILNQQEIVKAKERAEQSEMRLRQSETQLKLKLDKILMPDVEMPELSLTDVIEIEHLQLVQDSFAKALGVGSIITDVNGKPITRPSNFCGVCSLIRSTEKGRAICAASDAKIGQIAVKTGVVHIESCGGCGFVDAGSPIYVGNKLVAIWMIGQTGVGDVNEEKLVSFANEIDVSPKLILEEYRKMTFMSPDRFIAITDLLSIFAKEINSLAYHNILLTRKVEEQKEYEAKLLRSKEIAEMNELLVKKKNEEHWALNEELSEANTQLEEFNELIQKKVAEIKEREAILNSTINNIPFDFWARDINGVCFLQNEISKQYWGSMIGNTPDMQGVSEDTLAKWTSTNRRIYQGETVKEELEYLDKFGVRRNLQSITAPIVENGEVQGILGINIDISERKQFELDIIKAKEKAEESDRLKSTFLATMSHELRTPLNAIIGFSQILTGVHELEKVTGFSQIINQQGKHLLGIIESMFELSMLDAGEVKVKIEPFEIAGLFESLDQAAGQAQKKWNRSQLKVQYTPSKSTKGLMVFSDLSKLRQVLVNIVDNAIKFTLHGSVEYGFSVAGDDLTIFVKDTGKGIDPENFNIIFAPFRQVDDSFSREFDGVGLGLSICKKMITLLDGEITVQSELGKGSTFSIVLHNAIVNRNNPSQLKKDHSHIGIDLAGQTILVAEHDTQSQIQIGKYIQDVNGKVIVAKDGKEAVAIALKNDQISLILMDVKMPLMNGIEAMQRIKEVKPEITVVALTAFAMPGDQTKLLYYGFDDYLSKPVNPDQLNSKLFQYLKH